MKLAFLTPLVALALVGCGGIGAINIPLNSGAPAATGAPQDLTAAGAAPTTAVEATTLPPPGGAAGAAAATTGPAAAAPPDVLGAPANAANPAAQPATVITADAAAIGTLSVSDIVGQWNVRLGSDLCSLNFAFTDWIGLPDGSRGYRASTRACTADTLRNVAGFSVQGQDVVLFAADATALARLSVVTLTRDGTLVVSGRFTGQSNAGMAIEFYR